MSADGAGGDGGPKQRFELYIKASAIDKETKGSCPICQHWFMITCLLGENQDDIDFKVYTVQADCPPKNFGVEQGWSKKFPVVMVLEGRDKKGQDLAGTKYDTFEELEVFFESINKECPQLKRKNAPNVAAMKAVESVYNAFNTSLNTGQPNKKLLSELKKINEFLEEDYGESIYLVDNVLSFSDCYLLPRLQHIRVAGKEYLDFDIPANNHAIWRYLTHAYQTEAFRSTMPSDQDIVFHYEKKASNAMARKKRRPRPTLQNFTYTLDIPEDIATMLQGIPEPAAVGAGANGDVREEEESQAPVEQMSAVEIEQHKEEEAAVLNQSQEAAFGAEADDDQTPAPFPPPPVVDDEVEEDVVVEQAAPPVEAAPPSTPPPPSTQDEDGSCELPEESAYEAITAEEAVAVNFSPPPPPAADYDTGAGDAAAAADDQSFGENDEPNYVNVDVVCDDGEVTQPECTLQELSGYDTAGDVNSTASPLAEDDWEVRKEVGNGEVVKEEEDGEVVKEEEDSDVVKGGEEERGVVASAE